MPVTPRLAARSNVRAGMEVLAAIGMSVRAAVEARQPKALRSRDSAAANWELRAVIAGRRDQRKRLATRSGSVAQLVDFMPTDRPFTCLLTATLLHDNVGFTLPNSGLAV